MDFSSAKWELIPYRFNFFLARPGYWYFHHQFCPLHEGLLVEVHPGINPESVPRDNR